MSNNEKNRNNVIMIVYRSNSVDRVEPLTVPYTNCVIPKTVEVCSLFSSTHAQSGRISMGWGRRLFFI